MEGTIHEIVNRKMQEAGITVPDQPVYIAVDGGIPDCGESRYGQQFIPGAQVTVGEFIVIGNAYLSADLTKQITMPTEKNIYVLVEITNGCLANREGVFAESFREALIALDFGPYDAWEDFAVNMNECGLMSDDRLEEFRSEDKDDELREEVADYAIEHWGTGDCYILEIKPDGSVTTYPGVN